MAAFYLIQINWQL